METEDYQGAAYPRSRASGGRSAPSAELEAWLRARVRVPGAAPPVGGAARGGTRQAGGPPDAGQTPGWWRRHDLELLAWRAGSARKESLPK